MQNGFFKMKDIKFIEEVIYAYDYDDLSDYGKAIRDFCNYLNDSEKINQADIIKQIEGLK